MSKPYKTFWKLWDKITGDRPSSSERKQYYKFGKVIGSGTFGEVRQAVFIPTNYPVAIKVIKKSVVKNDETMVQKEINVVDAVPIIKVAFNAIAYLHATNIVHRDIKPENFLFLNQSSDAPLMLADFGISRVMEDNDEVLTTVCGSFAPEVLLKKGHGKPVDIWSLGTVTFSILCGYSPFWKYETVPDLVDAMVHLPLEFDERYWWGISEEAKDFIRKCLVPNPANRMTAEEALKHPWLTGITASSHDILPNVRENFNPRKAFVEAVSKIRVINRVRGSANPEIKQGPQMSDTNITGTTKADSPNTVSQEQTI
ncbi:hypothetical protein BB560_007168 [Smittium megazygosporum]|uniref:Protein kinase domain-containing protein n=1 Tax=Smittium megazygosporum TaxID=133381 RepID=A0A2T9XY94_9FUNG|nr:hypothetical protein BB560_007168 [Smittium megazygosporum]